MASASPSIHATPKCHGSGRPVRGSDAHTNSGETATPTTRSFARRPSMIAVNTEPGTRSHVSAKVALRTISSVLPGSTCLPDRICVRLSRPSSGPVAETKRSDDRLVAFWHRDTIVADDAPFDGRDAG